MSTLPTYTPKLSIKSWSEADRPREKLLLKGKNSLSDAELLAILISSGSRKESAVDLCKRILQEVDNDLHVLGKQTVPALTKFKGIGDAKAISIVAALELGRRRQAAVIRQRKQITSSKDAYDALAPFLTDLPHEEFWLLLLDRANKIIGQQCVSIGGVAGTVVDVKIVFKKAIDVLATGVILAHNHPSGNLKPSQADLSLTKQLVAAGKLLEVFVLDHLIIAENHYLSFADEGIL